MDEIFNGIFNEGSQLFSSLVKNVGSPMNVLKEPNNINEAIEMHEARLLLLKKIREQGFETLSSYNEYKKAEEIISRHQQQNQN